MRLIDADKIQEHLEKVKKESASLVDISHIIGFQSVVDAQPTAFDVDKVEKELEEKVENSNLNIQIICFSQALDIFKGGKND